MTPGLKEMQPAHNHLVQRRNLLKYLTIEISFFLHFLVFQNQEAKYNSTISRCPPNSFFSNSYLQNKFWQNAEKHCPLFCKKILKFYCRNWKFLDSSGRFGDVDHLACKRCYFSISQLRTQVLALYDIGHPLSPAEVSQWCQIPSLTLPTKSSNKATIIKLTVLAQGKYVNAVVNFDYSSLSSRLEFLRYLEAYRVWLWGCHATSGEKSCRNFMLEADKISTRQGEGKVYQSKGFSSIQNLKFRVHNG